MEKPRILVVDDEEIVQQLLKRTLGEKGYDVEAANDGSAALGRLKESSFNLLITDIKMPKADGISVLKEIKKLNPYIEVLIITGYPTIEAAVEAIKIGAYDFICKPFDISEILTIISGCLEKQKFNLEHAQLSELMTLFEFSKSITSTIDLNALLEKILNAALEITNAQRGSILVLDQDSKKLSIGSARGLSEDVIRDTKLEIGEGISGRTFKEGKPLLVEDIEKDERTKRPNKPQYRTKSFLSVPLMSNSLHSQDEVLAVLNLTDKVSGESFTGREQTLVSVLAGQAAVAIDNSHLYGQLQQKIIDLEQMIKRLNETQNQLIQTEKLASVGQLAFGFAHEIRNPLSIILSGMEFLESYLAPQNKVVENSIGKIKQSIIRANSIILELLKFSRASHLQLKTLNIRELIDGVVHLIQNRANLSNVKIKRDYSKKETAIKADENLLQQVFFNLCLNALDAMPKGGELSLSVQADKDSSRQTNKVIIKVADTGIGIPKENLTKIFDPFFTTKDPGKGTGLGLSIVHLILERHHGTIDVESQEGKGAEFIIKLPEDKGTDEKNK